MIYFFPSGITRKSSREIRMILKNGFLRLPSLKRLIITEKRLKKWKSTSDDMDMSTEKSAEDELIVMEDRKN